MSGDSNRFGVFYVIDENITGKSYAPQFLLSFQTNYKIGPEEK
jgi:hypothetical protein